jgi:hypothetical protein
LGSSLPNASANTNDAIALRILPMVRYDPWVAKYTLSVPVNFWPATSNLYAKFFIFLIMKKKYLILLIISVFFVSVAVRYWPIYHKGYSNGLLADNLILARNLSFANKYSIENSQNVILSSSLIKKEGISASTHNELTPIIYGKIFGFLGLNLKTPLYVGILLYSITTVLLFFLVLKLFGLKIALIFSGIDIFIPFVLAGSVWLGFYEWGMFFFVIGISIYLLKEKASIWRLLSSSLFLGLAALARNAFLISFVLLTLYDFYANFIYEKDWKQIKQWILPATKRIFVFTLPVILLFGGVMLMDRAQDRTNAYLNAAEAGYNGHLFPDPYTYHFEKETFISQIKNTAQGDQLSALISYGYVRSLKAIIKIYFTSIKYYITAFTRQPSLGGSLVLFFLVLGAVFLYRRNKKLFVFSASWIILLFLVLIALRTSNDDHFLEIRFPLVLLISLGIFGTLSWLRGVIQNRKTHIVLTVAILLVLLVHLIQSDKWRFHEDYENSNMEKRIVLVNAIKERGILNKEKDIIAVGIDDNTPAILNWYTDLSYIYFSPETVGKLLKENKLQWAFDQFGVTGAAGYDKDILAKIANQTNVKTISFNETN